MICVKKNTVLKIFITLCAVHISGVYGMNLLHPYDVLIRPPFTGSHTWQLAAYGEGGVGSRAFNTDGDCVDVLRIWNEQQDALSMLDGFDPDSAIGQLRTQLDANDNGTRGHVLFNGDFDVKYAFALSARALFYENFSLALYLPFYSMQLERVCWTDLTEGKDDADVRVKEFLTNDLARVVKELGDLDLSPWKRSGVGDLVAMIEWFKNFKQHKPFLKNVLLNARLGLGIPTGKRSDPDLLFALPFGNDGATSLIFGFNLDLTFGQYFKAGVDVQLTHIFDQIRTHRIKTDITQTDLLLLQKAEVHTDFGMTQQFSLYFDIYKFFKGASVKVGYQYYKRGENTVSLLCNDFDPNIVNTAINLQDFTTHQVYVNGYYDLSEHFDEDARVKPYVSLYARLPFNGKRVALERMIGAVIAVDF